MSKAMWHVILPSGAIRMPNQQFERVNVDNAEPFPSSRKNSFVLISVEPFTRWREASTMQY